MRRTAPTYRSWVLQSTSLGRSLAGIAYGILMCVSAVLRLTGSDARDTWLNLLILALGAWIGIGSLTTTTILLRFPQLRGTDLPRKPVSRRAVQVSTLTLILVACLTAMGGVLWWLTDDGTPWAVVLGVGALLTVGAFFDRYLLLNRARNEALIAARTPDARLGSSELEPPEVVGSPSDRRLDGGAKDGQ